MASYGEESEEEGSLQLPAHIGKELGFNGKHKDDKKTSHLVQAEKTLLGENVPTMALKVGCMMLYQDAKIRTNRKASKLNFNRAHVIESILHQSRATELHREEEACQSCKDRNGYFASCRTLGGFCDGCCANCMSTGEGYKRCSFVAKEVKENHKRKKSRSSLEENPKKKQKTGARLEVRKLDYTDAHKALAEQHNTLSDLLGQSAMVQENIANLHKQLAELEAEAEEEESS